MSENKKALVRVENLKVHFPVKGGWPFAKKKYVKAVNDVSFEIRIPNHFFGFVYNRLFTS